MSYKVYNKRSIEELPKAVIFDTDNTLYPYLPAHQAASKALAFKANKLLGIPIKLFNSEFEKARKETENSPIADVKPAPESKDISDTIGTKSPIGSK